MCNSIVMVPQKNVQLAASVLYLTAIALKLAHVLLMSEGEASLYSSFLKKKLIPFLKLTLFGVFLNRYYMSPLMQLYAFLILEGYIMYGIIKNKILKKICCLLYTLTIKSELRVRFCRFFYVIAFVLTLVLQSGTNLLQNSTISSNSYSISRSYSSYIPNIYYVIFTTTNTL